MNLLHIDSSALGEHSASRRISAAVVTALTDANPGLRVVRRDLEAAQLPHLGAVLLPTIRPDLGGESPAADAAEAAAVLAEFQDADIVVVGAPMYNFTIPSQLKAWIDRVAVAGKTFAYTAEGPKGLSGGKRVIVASSRGGVYSAGTPFAANDFHETYLSAVFRFLGVDTVDFVRAEGLAFGPDQREAALTEALASIPALAATFAPAMAA